MRVESLANAQRVTVDPALLGGDLQSPAHAALAAAAGNSLAGGMDVIVDIAPPDSAQGSGNPQLVASLASLLARAAREASALVLTGGETAAALLNRLDVKSMRLLDEIEPGIPLGLTLGGISVPVVTKAGGFGDEGCLKRIIERLRFMRQTGTVA